MVKADQILVIDPYILTYLYQITFEYTTKRHNRRQRIVHVEVSDPTKVIEYFYMWINNHNEQESYRPYHDVSIIGDPIQIDMFRFNKDNSKCSIAYNLNRKEV